MCPIEPRFFSAEYNGLTAAPGTPKAMVTPSFSRIRTAASIARIFAMSRLALGCWLRQRSSRQRSAISTKLILFPAEWKGVAKATINQLVAVITAWKLPRLRDIAGQTSQLVCLATIHANVASGSAEEIANVLVWKSWSGPSIRGQKVTAFASLVFLPNGPPWATGLRTVDMFGHPGWNGGARPSGGSAVR